MMIYGKIIYDILIATYAAWQDFKGAVPIRVNMDEC